MSAQKQKHGGARPGAGRPKREGTTKIKITVPEPQAEWLREGAVSKRAEHAISHAVALEGLGPLPGSLHVICTGGTWAASYTPPSGEGMWGASDCCLLCAVEMAVRVAGGAQWVTAAIERAGSPPPSTDAPSTGPGGRPSPPSSPPGEPANRDSNPIAVRASRGGDG